MPITANFAVGKLDRQIVLQEATVTQDPDTNEEVQTWDDTTIAAEWLPGNPLEAYRAEHRLAAYIDGIFRIHYRDPRPAPESHRVVFEGRTYDLKGVTEIARKRGLELSVVARGETP